MVMLLVHQDDAGVARGGTASVGDARRGTMMQVWQVFGLPVVSSFPRHGGLRPACRVLIPASHRSSTCLSCPHSRAMEVFGLPVVSSFPRHAGLWRARLMYPKFPCHKDYSLVPHARQVFGGPVVEILGGWCRVQK